MPLANSKKGARAISRFQEEAVKPAIRQLLHNEQVTQKKLADLAGDVEYAHDRVTTARDTFNAFAQMTFLQRLSWLFRGAR